MGKPFSGGGGSITEFALSDRRNSIGQEDEMIKKVKGGYQVVSGKGRNLGGPYKSLEEAKKRLRQIEFFKHRKA